MMLSVASKHLVRRFGVCALAPLSSSRVFSTSTNPDLRLLHQLQSQLWERYLASGRGGDYLFSAIDQKATGKLTASEIRAFVKAVPHDGTVREEAFAALQNLADDHAVTPKEFLRWLVTATKFSGCSPATSDVQESYESHPLVGLRRSSTRDPKPEYSWNEDSMAQNLRRMECK